MEDLFDVKKTRLPKNIQAILGQQKPIDIDNFHLKLNKAAYFEHEKKIRDEVQILPWEKRKFLFAKYERNLNSSKILKANFGKFSEPQVINQLAKKQLELANAICGKDDNGNDNFVVLTMKLDWRMAIGLGQDSIYETGLTLHHIYGIPYIPASSLKGVVRSFMIQDGYGSDLDSEARAFNEDKLLCDIFGCGEEISKKPSFYKANSYYGIKEKQGEILFFDAYPINVPTVEPDVMNPHYPDYYMRDKLPTDYQSPIPIMFLTIKDCSFQFVIGLKQQNKTDEKLQIGSVKNEKYGEGSLLQIAKKYLDKTLTTHGIGAKTSVGYGYMSNQNTTEKEKDAIDCDKKETITKITVPQFMQKGQLKPQKRYEMEAVVTKSGTTNFADIYVKEGYIQKNVKLDKIKNPLEVGLVIIVEVEVDKKEQVIQASYKCPK